MWEPSCRSTSSARFVPMWTPIWLVIVPEGAYRAASLPSKSATYSSSRFTVGSSPKTSSPTVASITLFGRSEHPKGGREVDLRHPRQALLTQFADHPPPGLDYMCRAER